MKNENPAPRSRVERLHQRKRYERFFLHPGTIVATGTLGLALVLVPLTQVAANKAKAAASKVMGSELAASETVSRPAGTPSAEKVPSAVAETEAASAAPAEAKPAKPQPEAAHKTRLVAFYADWGDEGYKSLERNIDEIDVLMPMWYHIGNDGKLTLGNPKAAARVMRLIRRENPDMKVMPIVNNYDKRTETWNPERMAQLMRKPAMRKKIAERIVTTMKREGFDGINMDLEGFKPKDRAAILAFMKTLYPKAHAAGLEVSQDVIVGSAAYDHKKLSRYVDYMIPMMYDEHWKTSGPGPIASQAWYEKTLRKFFRMVPPEKVIIGMGTYAYNWGTPGTRAKAMTYAEAKALARKKKKPIKATGSGNSTFAYRSSSGTTRRVWMLDAVSAFNQVKAASEHEPNGYAIWRLGAEDPGLWDVLPERDDLDAGVARSLEAGKRSVTYDEDRGLITWAQVRP